MRSTLKHLDQWKVPADVLAVHGFDIDDTSGWMWQINRLRVIASWGMGWDHVSVSLPDRCPTWDEMCWIKGLFFAPDECVIQYHPPESEYVNNHRFCLHMWRPHDVEIPLPPSVCVGIKSAGVLT